MDKDRNNLPDNNLKNNTSPKNLSNLADKSLFASSEEMEKGALRIIGLGESDKKLEQKNNQ